MRRYLLILLFSASFFLTKAQQVLPDSLKKVFLEANDDSARFKTSRAIYTFYEETNRDSALGYAMLRYGIAKKHHRNIEEAYLQGQMAYQQIYLGRFSEALTNLTKAMQVAREAKEANTWELTAFNTAGKNKEMTLSMLNHMYGHLKLQTGSTESVYYFKEGRRIGMEIGNNFRVTVADMVLASDYLFLNNPDSALLYAKEGEVYGSNGGVGKYLAYIYSVMGDIYRQKRNDSLALFYYYKSLEYGMKEANFTVVAGVYGNLIKYYKEKNNADSLLYYAEKNVVLVRSLGGITSFVTSDVNLGKAYQDLAMAYSLKKNVDSTNTYLQLALKVKDSIMGLKLNRLAAFQRLTLDEQVRLQNDEKNRIEAETKQRMYLLIAGIVAAFIIILLVYRNNRQKQKANINLQKEKEKVESTLQELKLTQQQLIQSEKMASLGELTAGIAHEIQNPLNFVNNFSDVNKELLAELKDEIKKGNIDEVNAIADDVISNEEKINHHGKRADAIVKGMLQHSRSGSGQKEPADINALSDEYLRLAYHGLRAKDKSFNATLKTDYDESVGKINIVPQDIGRVILNLITNAFYATAEKKKTEGAGFEPTVSIATKKMGDKIVIRVQDNGGGIPQNIVDKIFQPFFTTKPTGQGTGLGLSLAYDIVKAHGGELTVKTQAARPDDPFGRGEGTVFIIQLPTA